MAAISWILQQLASIRTEKGTMSATNYRQRLWNLLNYILRIHFLYFFFDLKSHYSVSFFLNQAGP